jgi:ABC-type multidrug transport system permease subunit
MFDQTHIESDNMDAGKPESKLHENLRYIGYTVPIVCGMILVGLVWLFLEPIIAFLWSFIFIIGIICVVLILLGGVVYLAFYRNKE